MFEKIDFFNNVRLNTLGSTKIHQDHRQIHSGATLKQAESVHIKLE